MSIRIGQASLGETGAHGQQAGNQNGRELNFSSWYNGRWLGVLRFKNAQEAQRAAQACEDGVRNKNIGYDQDGRNTAYLAAEAVDFDLSRINKPVETDCSAFMTLCAVAAGVVELKSLFKKFGNSCTTYCMMHDWPKTGHFELLSAGKYLCSDEYLCRGDILVSSGHTVMALADGKFAEGEREMIEKSKIIIDGKEETVRRILKDGSNYINVRDLAAALGLEISNKGNIAVLTRKEK